MLLAVTFVISKRFKFYFIARELGMEFCKNSYSESYSCSIEVLLAIKSGKVVS